MKKTRVRMVAAAVVWSGLSNMPARAEGLAQTITLRAALKKFGLGLALAGVGLAPGARADTVTEWNANLERAIFATAQPVAAQPRFSAIVHSAIYDAVNGIARKYTPYFVTEAAPPAARQEAAAAQAAYTALKALYPSQAAALDTQLAESLANIPGNSGSSVSIARGRAWGEHVANLILAWRSTDGWSTPLPPYFGGGAPGVWRSPPTATNPDGTLPALFPQMAVLVPFAMTNHDAFRPGPPPALTSALYAADVNEVKAIGRFDSALRTAQQTQLALLWQAAGLVDENRIARSVVPPGNSLVDNARLFALLNIAACDALVAGFDSKYAYNLWRPYHAIRLADTDGNPDTIADPAWNSLFLAPRFQEYISNHASLTGSFMHVLARELGDEHSFTLSSPNYPAYTWTFDRFSDAAAQVKEARIWAGIHFRNSCNVGEAVGVAIADYVIDNFLLPLETEDEQ
jgi:PAP2 superfamily